MQNSAPETVYVVDDDPDVRESLQWLLESVGLRVVCFATALEFFNGYPAGACGCIVMDVRMPGLSGINAQKQLPEQGIDLPLIMISAHGNIDMAVTAMTQGAVTFLEKPFDDQTLIDHVHNALFKDRALRAKQSALTGIKTKYASLTKRERQVMAAVVAGLSNQEIADQLAINRKTVEGHRANMLNKMAIKSLPELVQAAIGLGLVDD